MRELVRNDDTIKCKFIFKSSSDTCGITRVGRMCAVEDGSHSTLARIYNKICPQTVSKNFVVLHLKVSDGSGEKGKVIRKRRRC
jgi:hypothetical protein